MELKSYMENVYKQNPVKGVGELCEDSFLSENGWFRVFHEGVGEGIASESEGIVAVYDDFDVKYYHSVEYYKYNPKAWIATANGGWDKIYAGNNGGNVPIEKI